MAKQENIRSPYSNARDWLRRRGFKTLPLIEQVFNSPRLWVAAFLALTLLASARHIEEIGKYATLIAAMAAIGFGFDQWKRVREERGIEDFYGRLESLNKLYLELGVDRKLLGFSQAVHSSKESFQDVMLVFREIDNLECIIQKYRLGLVGADLAVRAAMVFIARCSDDDFRGTAHEIVGEGSAYMPTTCHVVRALCIDAGPVPPGKALAAAGGAKQTTQSTSQGGRRIETEPNTTRVDHVLAPESDAMATEDEAEFAGTAATTESNKNRSGERAE